MDPTVSEEQSVPESISSSSSSAGDLPVMLTLLLALAEISVSAVLFLALFSLSSAVLTRDSFLSRWSLPRSVGLDLACKSVSAAFAVSAASAGVFLMTSEKSGIPGNPNPALKHVLLVVIAYFLYDLYAMYVVFEGKYTEKTGSSTAAASVLKFCSDQPLLILHHLGVGVFFTPMMMFRLDHDPGELMIACALIFEASTPFVSLRAILSHLNLKKTTLYVVNGLVMVVVFLCCRILVYPCFYYSYASRRGITMLQALANSPRKCSVFQVLVLAPQLYWFQVMVRGALKVVRERNDEEIKKKTE